MHSTFVWLERTQTLMDWEENARTLKASAGLLPSICWRDFESGHESEGRCISAQLPSLAYLVKSKAAEVQATSSKASPLWRVPMLQPITYETTREQSIDESEQYDAEATDNDRSETRIMSPPDQVTKSSRYLREIDRRSIVLRIGKGEKQSNLAREFKVSRAAVCYLNKHRIKVLARTDADLLARHLKKPRLAVLAPDMHYPPSAIVLPSDLVVAALALPSIASLLLPRALPHDPVDPPAPHSPDFVHEIKTRAMELLLTKIQDITTSPAEFQRDTSRMMLMLAEEALASVAIVPVEVSIGQDERIGGYSIANPSCAISMMTAACPMLSILSQLEPELPSGYAHVHRVNQSFHANQLSVELTSSNLPATLSGHNTLVLDLVSGSGHQLCAVIGKLFERGASTPLVTVVSLFASSDAIAMTHDLFPTVRFLLLQLDPPMDISSAWPQSPTWDRQFWQWCTHLYEPRPSSGPDWRHEARH